MLTLSDWLMFFAFLLVVGGAFLLLYMRMQRIESRLRENQAKKRGEEKVKGLMQAIEDLDLRPIESYLFEMKEILLRVEKRLILAPTISAAGEERAPSAAPGGLGQVVEERLTRLGFQRIRMLTDPQSVTTDPCEIQVEAAKDDVTYKGRLLIHGGVVVESRMQPSYEVFP